MKKLLAIVMVLAGTSAFAGECVIHTVREACAGKEEISYKKCEGKKECGETTKAATEKDCAKKALKSCDNARLDITKSKTITAKFDGKDVEGGKNFCAADRADFNKCDKK